MSKEEPASLLVQSAGVQQFEESGERQTKPGIVSWSPPLPNWNPWTNCNIDEGPLASVTCRLPSITSCEKMFVCLDTAPAAPSLELSVNYTAVHGSDSVSADIRLVTSERLWHIFTGGRLHCQQRTSTGIMQFVTDVLRCCLMLGYFVFSEDCCTGVRVGIMMLRFSKQITNCLCS